MLGPNSSPSTPAFAGYPPRSPFIRRISPPGSPAPSKNCCYELHHHREATQAYQTQGTHQETFLCCCYTVPARSSASVLATLGVCFLVLAYTVLGAFTFMALEGGIAPSSTTSKKAARLETFIGSGEGFNVANELRSQTVDRLWSITENLNILYRENWTKLAAEEVLEFQEALFRALRNTKEGFVNGVGGIREDEGGKGGSELYHPHREEHRWTFTSSFLYSLTLITTIGYGSVAPRTSWGKLVTIIYALVGIPLMLLYLSTTGDVLARSFRRLYGKICGIAVSGNNPKQPRCQCSGAKIRVPVTLCLAIVLAYICSGAFLFHRLENWSILDGSYFCFTSLGTIGFGDLLPGRNIYNKYFNNSNSNANSNSPNEEDKLSLFACSAYILTGMALVAMCFSLAQEEVAAVLRLIGAATAECKLKKRPVEGEDPSRVLQPMTA